MRLVVLAWVAIAMGLGAFAPRAEHALSGAGGRRSTRRSAAGARTRSWSSCGADGDLGPALERVRGILEGDERVASVSEPQLAEDGRTAIVTGCPTCASVVSRRL